MTTLDSLTLILLSIKKEESRLHRFWITFINENGADILKRRTSSIFVGHLLQMYIMPRQYIRIKMIRNQS